MEEEVNGDSLFDETSSEAKLDAYSITDSYVWGELAEYKIVGPTTKEERREAHLAAQALKESRPQESTTPSPQVQVPIQDAKTPTPSNTMDDALVGQTVNPFGEQNNPIASAPRKRGRPCGTTKQAQANSKTCNPVGRPRKEAP